MNDQKFVFLCAKQKKMKYTKKFFIYEVSTNLNSSELYVPYPQMINTQSKCT